MGVEYDATMEDPVTPTRVKFYGAQDLATGWEAERAATLVQEYGAGRKTRSVNDALELHNALAFEENGILPSPLDEQGRASLASSVRESRREVASFFSGMDASNVESLLADLEFQYAEDLIFLIERYGVAKRVGGQVLFEALLAVRVPLAVMLSNHKFVKRYDRQQIGRASCRERVF